MSSAPDQRRQARRSALDHFGQIARRIAGNRLALFLDYDGTLTPIVDRPEDASLSGPMRLLLAELSRRYSVAIVSGRDLNDVRQMVGLESLVYAGSHGFDIAGPAGLRHQHDQARQCLPALDAAERELHAQLDAVQGVRVERKHFAIAIHYRLASGADQHQIETAVNAVDARHPSLRKKGGKKVFELQPDVRWHKGYAVLWLRQTLGLDRPNVMTFYIGDDQSDEDAFVALAEQQAGVGIIVAVPGLAVPEPTTHAQFFLEDCDAVQRFLEALRESS